MTHDIETLCVVQDPHANENISVRVLAIHDLPYSDHQVIGVFRLDDDSEIDFTSLALTEQDKINKMCENEIQKAT